MSLIYDPNTDGILRRTVKTEAGPLRKTDGNPLDRDEQRQLAIALEIIADLDPASRAALVASIT